MGEPTEEGIPRMRLARRASLVVVLLVLASVGIAWAEWVLWENAVMIVSVNPTKASSGDWKMHDCFQTPEVCQRSRDVLRQISQSTKSEHIGVQYSEYECLPDTVDPRGPKGSVR
jgi:hypothetical protein